VLKQSSRSWSASPPPEADEPPLAAPQSGFGHALLALGDTACTSGLAATRKLPRRATERKRQAGRLPKGGRNFASTKHSIQLQRACDKLRSNAALCVSDVPTNRITRRPGQCNSGHWKLMDETDQWKTTTSSPLADDDHDALAKSVCTNGRPRLFSSSGMAAFASSQWKARDQDGVRCRCNRLSKPYHRRRSARAREDVRAALAGMRLAW
jgi:hypothetical protein